MKKARVDTPAPSDSAVEVISSTSTSPEWWIPSDKFPNFIPIGFRTYCSEAAGKLDWKERLKVAVVCLFVHVTYFGERERSMVSGFVRSLVCPKEFDVPEKSQQASFRQIANGIADTIMRNHAFAAEIFIRHTEQGRIFFGEMSVARAKKATKPLPPDCTNFVMTTFGDEKNLCAELWSPLTTFIATKHFRSQTRLGTRLLISETRYR